MRRNATKVAATVLTLAVTMTSVNMPTTAAAATKTLKLNAKKTKTATMRVGDTLKLKIMVGGKNVTKKATFTSKKTAVATVGKKTGVVKAKKKGTVNIVAKYKKKTYKCKITVKKKATTPSTSTTPSESTAPAESTAPSESTAPVESTAPSESTAPAESAAPAESTAPSESTTPGAVTSGLSSFKATKVDTLTAEFGSAIPEGATVEVTLADAKVNLTETWNTERTSVELKSPTALKVGEYTITVKSGADTYTEKATVETEKFEIKLVNKEKGILTVPETVDKKTVQRKAYIYYDVTNQYGESRRTSANIKWTVTGTEEAIKVDTSTGKLTVTSSSESGFTYNTDLYVVGVDNKTGATISEAVKIGLPQSVDSVKFTGKVVNKNDKTKALDSLPSNFATDTYYLLFNALDQNGNVIPATDIEQDSLTFIGTASNPLAIDNQFKLGEKGEDIFTIDGESYKGILINPGQQVDKGGEVTMMVMSTGTGNKSEYVFTIGETAILSSLDLAAPSGIIKDGSTTKLNYTAKDTKGNTVTSYETIARSSNTVNLTASSGTVKIQEENDGTAGIYWIDEDDYSGLSRFTQYDGRDRNVLITTIVIGGSGSSSLQLAVSDASYPAAIKSVILNADNNDTLVEGNTASIDLGLGAGRIEYLDQYNNTMTDVDANEFFEQGQLGNDKDTVYGIRVKSTAGEKAIGYIGLDAAVGGENGLFVSKTTNINFTAVEQGNCAVEYAIATSKGTGEDQKITDTSSVKRVNYSVVPLKDVASNLEIVTHASLYGLSTRNSAYPNGMTIAETVTGGTLLAPAEPIEGESLGINAANKAIELKGKTNEGLTLTIPTSGYTCTDNSAVVVQDGVIKSVRDGKISWYELYNVDSNRFTRINASKDIELSVTYGTAADDVTTVRQSITLSDAGSAPAVLEHYIGNALQGADVVIKPTRTKITTSELGTWKVKDQYGNELTGHKITLKASDPQESVSTDTHLTKSFTINKNGSEGLNISGAEIGDKFKLTATVDGYGLSKDVNVTIGSDNLAYFSSKEPDVDKNFRMAPFPTPDKDGNIGLGMSR